MSVSDGDVPLRVIIKNDAIDSYRALEPVSITSFRRSGTIFIEYDDDEKGFGIELTGDFEDAMSPRVRPKPAIIPLNRSDVFQIVQRCRAQWEKALASTMYRELKPDGTGRERYPFEDSWDKPVDEETFQRTAGLLAVAGSELFEALFERSEGTPLDLIAKKLRSWAGSGEDAITIQADTFQIPWRLIYTHPSDAGELARDGSNFRTEGFWGYQHILEQFPSAFAVPDYRLIVKQGTLSLGAALNENIDDDFSVACISSYRDFVKRSEHRLSSAEWTDVQALKLGLSVSPFPHQILYFLCHAEGAGAEFKPSSDPWIEIAGTRISVGDIRVAVKTKFGDHGPLVFLNACRSGQFETQTTHNFSFASEFLNRGAKGFLGAQIEVPAVFAGHFGGLFLDHFMSAGDLNKFLGYALRNVTRDLWNRRNPLGLVYSLYGGANCHIVWDMKAAS